jgi:hypothetical protein
MLINFKKLNASKIFKFSIIILLLVAIIIIIYYGFNKNKNENFSNDNRNVGIFEKCFKEDDATCFKNKMIECVKTENNKKICSDALLKACQKNVAAGNSIDPNECNELKNMTEKMMNNI